jgi:hypothetical protein
MEVSRAFARIDNPGYFSKSITVYTHAGDAPMKLQACSNTIVRSFERINARILFRDT